MLAAVFAALVIGALVGGLVGVRVGARRAPRRPASYRTFGEAVAQAPDLFEQARQAELVRMRAQAQREPGKPAPGDDFT